MKPVRCQTTGRLLPAHQVVKDLALERLAKGQTQLRVAVDLGLHQSTVSTWAIEAGVGLRKPKLSKATREMIHRLRAQDMPLKEVSQRTRVSLITCQRVLSERVDNAPKSEQDQRLDLVLAAIRDGLNTRPLIRAKTSLTERQLDNILTRLKRVKLIRHSEDGGWTPTVRRE